MATNGGISLSDLLKLPVRQLNVLRKAVDLERISWRKQFIHDTAMAFSDPKKGIAQLSEIERKINVGVDAGSPKKILWTPDEDAADKLARWMR